MPIYAAAPEPQDDKPLPWRLETTSYESTVIRPMMPARVVGIPGIQKTKARSNT